MTRRTQILSSVMVISRSVEVLDHIHASWPKVQLKTISFTLNYECSIMGFQAKQ